MSRASKLLLLVGLLLAAVGAYFLAGRLDAGEEAAPVESEKPLLVLSSRAEAELLSLAWDYAGEHIELTQRDGVWVDAAEPSFPLDQDYAVRMASAAASLKSIGRVGEATALADYGLAEPILRIEARFSDGTVAEYALGDENALAAAQYLLFENAVWLVDDTLSSAFSHTRRDILKRETIGAIDDLTAVELQCGDERLELVREEQSPRAYCGEVVWFCKSEEGQPAADTKAVKGIVSALRALSLEDVVSFRPSEEELAAWGLAEPCASLTLRYREDGNEKSLTALFGSEYEGKRAFMLKGSDLVCRVDREAADALLALSYTHDLLPRALCRIDASTLTALEITLGEESVFLRAEKNAEGEICYDRNGETVNAASVRSLLAAVYSAEAERTDGELERAGAQLLSLRYLRDAGAWSDMTLTLCDYGEDYVLCSFNAQAYQLIRRSEAELLIDFAKELF